MPVVNSPKHLGQASLSVPLIKQRLFASMDNQYLDKRVTGLVPIFETNS
jgi:hypothetical protein